MSIINNFKDISSRMQGELKAQPIKVDCFPCRNSGWVYLPAIDELELCKKCGNPNNKPDPRYCQ